MDQIINKILKEKIEKVVTKNHRFVIGVDTHDENNYAYCLVSKINENDTTIILSKVMRNEEDFNQEVENLTKYFNTELIKEK